MKNMERQNNLARKILIYVFLALFLFVIVFPYAWMGLTSVQFEIDLYKSPPFPLRAVPFTLSYYQDLFAYAPFTSALVNSALVALMTTGFVMVAGSLGAYAIARIRFKGSRALFRLVMIVYMLPGVALLIPMVVVLRTLGLMDTLVGMMFAHSIFVLPLMTWMLAVIFRAVPDDIEKAARVDGQNRLGVLFRVILPLSLTGVALISVFSFIISWNELMFSSVVGVREIKMLQPVILEFMGPMKQVIPTVAAAGVIGSMPVLVIAVLLQKYILRGIMKGAIK